MLAVRVSLAGGSQEYSLYCRRRAEGGAPKFKMCRPGGKGQEGERVQVQVQLKRGEVGCWMFNLGLIGVDLRA
jgi:hypothetical protein